MMSNKGKPGYFYGYVIVVALCLITATAVAIVFNCASIFFAPVSAELEISTGTFAIYFSCICLSAAASLTVAGRLFDKYNAKWIVAACSLFSGLCLLGMSQFTAIWQFYTAGIVLGACEAFLLYIAPAVLISRWFRVRTGLFLGLVSAFSGVGGVVFNQVGGLVMQEYGWRGAYFVFALITFGVAVPCSLLIVSRPSDKGQQQYGAHLVASGKESAAVGVSYATALKSSVFVMAVLLSFIVTFAANINNYLAPYTASLGAAVTVTATVASCSMFGNMLGKIIFGFLADWNIRLGLVYSFGCGIMGILVVSLLGGLSYWALYAGGFLFGNAYAAVAVALPLTVRAAFGAKDYAKIWSNVSVVSAGSATIATAAWGYIIGGFSYAASFFAVVVLYALAIVIGNVIITQGKKLMRAEAQPSEEPSILVDGAQKLAARP